MSEKRFIRNIMGNIYDSKTDKWFEEDWKGKPLDYDDDLIVFLNEQQEKITELERKIDRQESLINIILNNLPIHQAADIQKFVAESLKEWDS